MPKYTRLPAISGKKLIKLLTKAGWVVHGRTKHGISLKKLFADRTRVTVVPDTNASLDEGTLGAILSHKQTNIGKRGLLDHINKFGI